jgi:two-component system phosphate regulon sensor histidine kinase PhoR
MFRSRLFWRLFATLAGATLASFLCGWLLGDSPPARWAGLLVACGAAFIAAVLLARSLLATIETLTDSVRDIGGPGTERSKRPVRGDELTTLSAAVAEKHTSVSETLLAAQQRHAELEQNTTLLETILGTMIEGVIVVDPQERMLYANQAARALLDVKSRNVAGRPLLEVARAPQLQHVVQAALRTRELQQLEFDVPRKQKTIALTASLLPTDPYPGVVLVLHDVTELRRLERLRRDFVSNVSHELKTPLTSIQAYADTLLDGAIDDAAHNRTFLERIGEQAQRLQALILDLLSLARIESQPQQMFDIRPVRVADVARLCLDGRRPVAESKQIPLETALDEDLAVLADADGLRQIIDNLLSNAVNYTPAGGRVTVRARGSDGWGVLEVEDTGVGIAKQDQVRIFERFYRVDRARARDVGGTGLGLSIVKHLAQTFGGDVSVHSELGRGSTFTVRLPRAGTDTR